MLLWLLVLTGCVYYLLAAAVAFVKLKDEFYMMPGYTLKILKDTKLKQSTNQAITLSGSDLFEVKAGAEYPISSHTYQDGHVKFSLGKQDNKQIALAGRNTWFAWLGAVEVRKGGKPVAVSAPIATAVGSMMLMVPTGKADAYGADLFKLSWIKNGKEQDWVYVVSGQPSKKAVPREQDYSGSMRPCPSGTYSLGPTEEGRWGEGLGRIWISVYGTSPRQNIGIHVDGNRSYSPGCFDVVHSETQVLTPNGWLDWFDVSISTNVAMVDGMGVMVFDTPLQIIDESYSGKMIHVKANKFDALVTPNHRFACVDNSRNVANLQYKTAQSVLDGRSLRIPLSASLDGMIDIPEWKARLWIAFLADGHHETRNHTAFHFKKSRKIERIQQLLKDAGIEFKVFLQKSGSTCIKCPRLPFEKNVEPYQALDLSLATKKMMLEELIYWDGTASGRTSAKYSVGISTANFQQAEFYRLLAITSGYGASFRRYKDPRNLSWSEMTHLNIVEGRNSYSLQPKSREGSAEVNEIDYNGRVWCLKTSTSNFVVRHNGYVFITGNSAGCVTPLTESDMRRVAAWRDAGADTLRVEH